jgi:hypothetical protein
MRSRDSSVGIAMAYRVYDRASFPCRGKRFLLYSVQIGCGSHAASYPVGTRGFLTGGKWPGREADHSAPSSAEVKNVGAIPPHRLRLERHSSATSSIGYIPSARCPSNSCVSCDSE